MPYKRILLKLSGEALGGAGGFGFDPEALGMIAGNVRDAHAMGVQVGLVIGGGNFHRGAKPGVCENRVTSDQMGMLATVINALAMQDVLGSMGVPAVTFTAIDMGPIAEGFSAAKAISALEAGQVAIFAGGTGCPFFTTDSAAALRALEIQAEVLIKATKVNGVYDRDPMLDEAAVFFAELDFDEVLSRNLKVMDAAAISLCRDNELAIRVINIGDPANLKALLAGADVGSLVRTRR
jgi:uridylate kinase